MSIDNIIKINKTDYEADRFSSWYSEHFWLCAFGWFCPQTEHFFAVIFKLVNSDNFSFILFNFVVL